jgi:hypothetical protein
MVVDALALVVDLGKRLRVHAAQAEAERGGLGRRGERLHRDPRHQTEVAVAGAIQKYRPSTAARCLALEDDASDAAGILDLAERYACR